MAAARPMPINIRTTQLLKAKLIMAIPGTIATYVSLFLVITEIAAGSSHDLFSELPHGAERGTDLSRVLLQLPSSRFDRPAPPRLRMLRSSTLAHLWS
ncbi:hypothetical protein IG631_09166 [Alternaria alternata]|nr:hypothetical protein IG631_09166 [Alternaria alternata]